MVLVGLAYTLATRRMSMEVETASRLSARTATCGSYCIKVVSQNSHLRLLQLQEGRCRKDDAERTMRGREQPHSLV